MRWARENDFNDDINMASARWDVPVALIKAHIAVESGFDPAAVNYGDPGYAWGLMQMIPKTAAGLGYTAPMSALLTDTATAVDLGAHLISQNTKPGHAVADSISAYNGGFRPSLGFGSPLPSSGQYGNQDYVNKVLDALQYFQGQDAGTPQGGAVPDGATSFHPDRRPGMDAPRPLPAKRIEMADPKKIDLSTVMQILEQVAGLIHAQISDPKKDAQRLARLDRAYNLAWADDDSLQPDLDNLSGRDYIDYIVADAPVAGGGTSSGSKVARTYARLKQFQLQAHGAAS